MYENYNDAIFKYREILSPGYIPDHLPNRMKEVKAISQLTYESMEGKVCHILISGPPGTGKTVSLKFIFQRLEEDTDALAIYVNCFTCNTRMGALYAMVMDFFKKKRPTRMMPSRRGIAYDEMIDSFSQEVRKTKTKIVLCLDEVDQLLPKGEKLLYDLSRLRLDCLPIQIIAISNDPFVFKNLDPRAKSSLYPIEEITFEPYTPKQMKEIIKARADIAFQEGVVTKKAIDFLAEVTADQGGDVRIARETLLRAGDVASKSGSEKVNLDHIKKALGHSRFAKSLKILKEISKKERFILKMIPKEGVYYPQFFQFYRSVDGQLGDRMLRNYMDKFKSLKLINMEKKGIGGSYLIKLNVPRDVLFEIS